MLLADLKRAKFVLDKERAPARIGRAEPGEDAGGGGRERRHRQDRVGRRIEC